MATAKEKQLPESETTAEDEEGFVLRRLSARDSVRFLEILESDDEPSPALKRAKESHERLIRRRQP